MTVYATAAELRAAVDIDSNTDDAVILNLLTGVSKAIDRYCNRSDYGFVALSEDADDEFVGTGKSYIYIPECISITTVAVRTAITDTDYTDWESTDWFAFRGSPKKPKTTQTPYHGLIAHPAGSYAVFLDGRIDGDTSVPTVKVTAKWGYAATVPEPVKDAVIAEASRWYKMGETAYADALLNQEMGELRFFKDMSPVTKTALLLGRYMRPGTP